MALLASLLISISTKANRGAAGSAGSVIILALFTAPPPAISVRTAPDSLFVAFEIGGCPRKILNSNPPNYLSVSRGGNHSVLLCRRSETPRLAGLAKKLINAPQLSTGGFIMVKPVPMPEWWWQRTLAS